MISSRHLSRLALCLYKWCLLITLAIRLDPDQAGQNIRPGSDPNCFDILMVFLAEICSKIVDFEKSADDKKTCKFTKKEKNSLF